MLAVTSAFSDPVAAEALWKSQIGKGAGVFLTYGTGVGLFRIGGSHRVALALLCFAVLVSSLQLRSHIL